MHPSSNSQWYAIESLSNNYWNYWITNVDVEQLCCWCWNTNRWCKCWIPDIAAEVQETNPNILKWFSLRIWNEFKWPPLGSQMNLNDPPLWSQINSNDAILGLETNSNNLLLESQANLGLVIWLEEENSWREGFLFSCVCFARKRVLPSSPVVYVAPNWRWGGTSSSNFSSSQNLGWREYHTFPCKKITF